MGKLSAHTTITVRASRTSRGFMLLFAVRLCSAARPDALFSLRSRRRATACCGRRTGSAEWPSSESTAERGMRRLKSVAVLWLVLAASTAAAQDAPQPVDRRALAKELVEVIGITKVVRQRMADAI